MFELVTQRVFCFPLRYFFIVFLCEHALDGRLAIVLVLCLLQHLPWHGAQNKNKKDVRHERNSHAYNIWVWKKVWALVFHWSARTLINGDKICCSSKNFTISTKSLSLSLFFLLNGYFRHLDLWQHTQRRLPVWVKPQGSLLGPLIIWKPP